MRKHCQLFIALALLTLNFAFAKDENAYSLKVRVNGIKDTVCFLANYYGDKQYLKDTAKVDSKGNFTFDGKEKLPGGIYLVVLPGKKYFELVIPSDNEQNFSVETDTTDYIRFMKVKGSNENKLFYEFLNFLGKKSRAVDSLKKEIKKSPKDSVSLTKKMMDIDKEVQSYRKDFIKNNSNLFITKVFKASEEVDVPEVPILANGKKDSTFQYRFYKEHFFDNIDFSDERMIRTPIFHSKIEKYIKNLVIQIPDSLTKEIDFIVNKARKSKELFKYCVWYLNYTYETSQLMGMDAVFVHMAKKYYLTKDVDWVDSTIKAKFKEKAETLEPLLLGKVAPNTYLSDTLGNIIQLHSLKADYVILVFWDPNCGHCQKEIPKLHEWLVKKNDKRIIVYSVSIERKDSDFKKFIREKKLTSFINVWDKYTYTDFRKMWDIYSTPVIYIVDKNKKIIAKRLGAEQIDEFLTNYEKLEAKKAK
ncbi:MAG: redoxin domain-containing protein [Cytophagales bacterium]